MLTIKLFLLLNDIFLLRKMFQKGLKEEFLIRFTAEKKVTFKYVIAINSINIRIRNVWESRIVLKT